MKSKSKYDRANQVKEANKGNKQCELIAQIATPTVTHKERQVKLTTNLCKCNNPKTKEINAMTSQIKSLTNTNARLTHPIACKKGEQVHKQVSQQISRRGLPSTAVHQASKHGLLLLDTWIPPSRQESLERNMHVEKRRTQRCSHMDKQAQLKHILATTHPDESRRPDSRDICRENRSY